jgi:CRISPR-associated protein Cmr4
MPAHESYGFWRKLASAAIVLVADDDFRDFVRHGTEVVTRVQLDNKTKTVSRAPGGGALWTEENLPADTLLYSFVAGWKPTVVPGASVADAHGALHRLASLFAESWVIQVGGKETVGRGFVAARIVGGDHA